MAAIGNNRSLEITQQELKQISEWVAEVQVMSLTICKVAADLGIYTQKVAFEQAVSNLVAYALTFRPWNELQAGEVLHVNCDQYLQVFNEIPIRARYLELAVEAAKKTPLVNLLY